MNAPRMRARRFAALGLAVALLAGGCTSDDGSDDASPTQVTEARPPSEEADEPTTTTPTEAEPEEVTDGDFYAVPDPLPGGDHGTLIRYQEVTPSVVDEATTYRVMYRSESLEGDPIAVTGIVLVPEGDAPAGGRPLLTVAHGTTGVATSAPRQRNRGASWPWRRR